MRELARLTARRSARPVREPSGWLVTDPDPQVWIEELARFRLDAALQESVEIYVLPERRGALIGAPEHSVLDVTPSGAPYARLGARLWLPADAVLEPELSLAELDRLLRHDVTIFHPGSGWVGFGRDQVLAPSGLLELPKLGRGRFRSPSVVSSCNDRIVSVSLAVPVSLDQFFEEEKEDIGSASPDDLPPSEGEPGDGLVTNFTRKAIEPIARGARALTRRLRGAGSEDGWADRLEHWANERLRKVSGDVERLRNKELHRLLDLLDTDAEKGLQHALPLGGGAHRGLARPGARLASRRVDFHLGALRGGQPLDPWDVPYELQQQLLAKYRELAVREKSLGRYRRAAYIYAELMGDLETAAAVLKEGKHYREAAEVYQSHLHKPHLAARAYAAGGFYREAVEIYEELGHWEDAGDLYRKTDQQEKADAAFRKACERLLGSHDRLGAARIAETKLEDVERALDIVSAGWPDSRQAGDCLKRQLDIQAREGYHDRTEALFARLAHDTEPPHLAASLVESLSHVAVSYPNAPLRSVAADLTRRKISSRLVKATRDETARLLGSLYRLAPEDRLLARDGGRFLSTKERRKRVPAPRRGAHARPELVRAIELPTDGWYLDVKSNGSLFFALHCSRDELRVTRGNWGGGFEHLSWPRNRSDADQADDTVSWSGMFELDATGHRSVVVRYGASAVTPNVFPPSREVIDAETWVGDPEWLPPGAVDVTNVSQTWIVLRQHRTHVVLSTYSFDGDHLSDVASWPLDESLGAASATLAAQNQFIVVGQTSHSLLSDEARPLVTSELLIFDAGHGRSLEDPLTSLEPHRIAVPAGVLGLRVAQPYTRSRVAALLTRGVLLHWLDSRESFTVAADLAAPKASMLRNGSFIVAAGQVVRVYRTDLREPVLTSEMEVPTHQGQIVDVVPGYSPNQFALLSSDGRVQIFALPSG